MSGIGKASVDAGQQKPHVASNMQWSHDIDVDVDVRVPLTAQVQILCADALSTVDILRTCEQMIRSPCEYCAKRIDEFCSGACFVCVLSRRWCMMISWFLLLCCKCIVVDLGVCCWCCWCAMGNRRCDFRRPRCAGCPWGFLVIRIKRRHEWIVICTLWYVSQRQLQVNFWCRHFARWNTQPARRPVMLICVLVGRSFCEIGVICSVFCVNK